MGEVLFLPVTSKRPINVNRELTEMKKPFIARYKGLIRNRLINNLFGQITAKFAILGGNMRRHKLVIQLAFHLLARYRNHVLIVAQAIVLDPTDNTEQHLKN